MLAENMNPSWYLGQRDRERTKHEHGKRRLALTVEIIR